MQTAFRLFMIFCLPVVLLADRQPPNNQEKLMITNPFRVDANAVILQLDSTPKFIFKRGETFRVRKTKKAKMYEHKTAKPDKPYRHLALFLELLSKETGAELPPVEVIAVTPGEFLEILEVDGFFWLEPLVEGKENKLVWFPEEDFFRVFTADLKNPVRVLTLEHFLAHLILMSEWETGVKRVSPEDTDILINKRQEEWEKKEGRALVLFNRILRHWKLLQLNWPPEPFQRPKVFSVPLPWPPWPLPRSNRK